MTHVSEPELTVDSLYDVIAARSGSCPVGVLSPKQCESVVFEVGRPLLNSSSLPLVRYVIGENCLRELGRVFRKYSGRAMGRKLAELEVKYQSGGLPRDLFQNLVCSCFDALKNAERRNDEANSSAQAETSDRGRTVN